MTVDHQVFILFISLLMLIIKFSPSISDTERSDLAEIFRYDSGDDDDYFYN